MRRSAQVTAVAVVAVLFPPLANLAAAFPGANGRLVYERGTPLYTVKPDATGETKLTADNYSASDPSWSPDGNRIAFAYAASGAGATPGWGIWVINADGTAAHQVTSEPQNVAGGDGQPAWSPDGSKIAFVRRTDLLVMNADGTGSTNLTANFTPSVEHPAWSPRGDKIAFSTGDIYVINADGSGTPQQLTPQGGAAKDNPSWSPDGSRIAYGQLTEIRAVDPSGASNVQLAGGFREVWDVAWSPDGGKIAFINDPGTNSQVQEELYVMNADGSGPAPLGVDTDTTLDWGVQVTPPGTPPGTPTGVPPPVYGRAVNVRVLSGRVFMSLPAGAAFASLSVPGIKGRRFVPLTQERQIPVGSLLDTRKGTVALTSARNTRGATQSGAFTSGVFQVLQSRSASARGLTELRLKGSSFRSCVARRSGTTASAALSRRVIRRMRSNASGRFRTRGRYSAATVRGTIWDTVDRCDGTLTRVRRGRVVVRDFRKRRNITLRAGKTYLARAPS